MPNPKNPESYEEQLDAIRDRLDLAEHEMTRVRMGLQTLLILARSMTELFPVLAESIQDIAAGLDMDLDEDMEDEPDATETITVGGLTLTVDPSGEVTLQKPAQGSPAGSGD